MQFIKSNEELPIYYYSDQIANFENPKNLINQKHLYLLSFKKIKNEKNKNIQFIQLLKNSKNKIRNSIESYNDYLLKLESSKYQIQFLDKFIYKGKKWQNVEISLSEWSLVLEKEFEIRWDIENEIPVFITINHSRKNKLYIAIPFNIKSNLKKYEENFNSNIIMGIDIGEYGVAYVVVDFKNNKNIKILNSGFIYSKNIAKIKDEFSKIQQKSKTGIFNESSSLIAEIRENAVGNLRNKIHSIFINYHPQNIAYEFSINNFETGSGKTVSIYKTIKKSDVPSIIDADKKAQKHIWGTTWNKNISVGQNLSAYASSYLCSNCFKSIYEINKDDLDQIYIKNRNGNILELESPQHGLFYGFSTKKEYSVGYKFKKTDNALKNLIKILKDFARPPLKNSEVVSKFVNKNNEKDLENFRKRRGNSSIFVCPFCFHISDADIQAALMMAIRGYIKNNSKNSDKNIDYFKENINFLKNLEEKPTIFLDLNKK
ncbi:MAG: type V CRISPR-associated protein Cas12d [bacterium]|nr:type V CRISPR-associated protein Cas12d [bacterium]